MKNAPIVTAVSLVLGLIGAAAVLVAGPLDPPAGSVTPTYKTLTQVEPRTEISAENTPGDANSVFKITLPGSYYLSGNVNGEVGKHGIEIAVSGVTIDLNGFDLSGVAGMGLFDGVSVTAGGLSNIAVTNGSVRGWGDEGVDVGTNNPTNCRVDSVLASGNAGTGVAVGTACVVSNCEASLNGSTGMTAQIGSSFLNCTSYQNTGAGFFASEGSTFTNCRAADNSARGFSLNGACTVIGSTAFSNGSDGISGGAGATITHCTASANTGSGILGATGCTIVGCTAKDNTLDGVKIAASCVIRGNTCSNNGAGAGDGAGIHATGGDNRIEDNHCAGADRGIDVDLAGNIIIRNTCAGNTTDWDIVANNICGPILDRRAPGSAAVVGFSAASSLASTDPHANFSY